MSKGQTLYSETLENMFIWASLHFLLRIKCIPLDAGELIDTYSSETGPLIVSSILYLHTVLKIGRQTCLC